MELHRLNLNPLLFVYLKDEKKKTKSLIKNTKSTTTFHFKSLKDYFLLPFYFFTII